MRKRPGPAQPPKRLFASKLDRSRQFLNRPWQAVLVEHLHEGIGVHFFHVEHAPSRPDAPHHHRTADHRGNAGGVAHRLVAGFLIGGLMRANVLDVERLLARPVDRFAGGDAADVGVALSRFAQRLRLGQHCGKELQWDDLHALVLDRLDRSHADVLQNGKMRDVLVPEGHPEARARHLGIELREAFQLLVIHHVHVLEPHGLEVELDLLRHRRGLDELAILPVPRRRGHFANVDFRVEIGGEMLAVVTAITIEDVERADGLELVFLEPHGEHAGHPRIEARTEQRHDPRLFEAIMVGPLPAILELGFVLRLVISGVEIVHTRFKAGVHHWKVLVRQRQIHHQRGLNLSDQIDHRWHFLGINLVGRNFDAGALLDRSGNGIALALGAASKMDIGKNFPVHRHLVDADRADAAGTDHEDCGHGTLPFTFESCALSSRMR